MQLDSDSARTRSLWTRTRPGLEVFWTRTWLGLGPFWTRTRLGLGSDSARTRDVWTRLQPCQKAQRLSDSSPNGMPCCTAVYASNLSFLTISFYDVLTI
ncbi:hypothetical protein HOLleu_32506 [Holothuria leucospilota]|uniref:Uncharacterized protein n=1 Tax=Holothuria leucospilota TaxID=206669 RepID=A0A9Q1GZZ4_HOLLE|nr:hypothetical protein HOLleu_32506 [Holothuria leucospilota]